MKEKIHTILYMYCTYNVSSTIYQKQELFIEKHKGITSNKGYVQANITSYVDGGLLKRSHSKIIQQLCNPQGSG